MAKAKKSSRIYFTKVIATASGDAFIAGHMQDQGSDPTFTRFMKAGDAGWGHIGDLGAVVYAAVPINVENSPRPWIAIIGQQGPLRLYKPGQQPVDIDVSLKDTTSDIEGMCSASDGLYVCGGQRQVMRYSDDKWHNEDEGLFEKFDGTNDTTLFSIAEVAPGILIAVGSRGFITCREQGAAWKTLDSGTNLYLHCIIPAGDGGAWVSGDGGTLLKIPADMVSIQDCSAPELSRRKFGSLALYKGALYVTAVDSLLVLQPGRPMEKVQGPFKPGSEFHCVSGAGDYLWVTGDEHVYRLGPDGWQYFLCLDNA
jgi:hypothetical protein